jgi:carbon-monoxide dehydrogenase medium subunit/xanthine dehydrogenase FAD-binding subunit
MDSSGRGFDDVRLAIGGVGPKAQRMTAIEQRLNGQPVSAALLRDVQADCHAFVQSRTRQEYRRSVTSDFLVRGLAKALGKCGVHPDIRAAAEEVAHG